MTQTPTDRNQALRDALEEIEHKARLAADMCDTHGRAGGFRIIASLARSALAMQEPASEPWPKSEDVIRRIRDEWPDPMEDWPVVQPASEPAPDSAPSCCGADEPVVWISQQTIDKVSELVLAVGVKTVAFRDHAKGRHVGLVPLYARAQPCQCGELREALEPFADIGQWLFARDLPDDTPLVEVRGLNGATTALTRGHFKAAHKAISSEPCPYCTNVLTGLPGNACENCMNTGLKYPAATAPRSGES